MKLSRSLAFAGRTPAVPKIFRSIQDEAESARPQRHLGHFSRFSGRSRGRAAAGRRYERERNAAPRSAEGAAEPSAPGPEDRFTGSPELLVALDRLDEREREILALRYGADLSGAQIAELLGLSLANVQQIASRALRRLRELLEPTHVAPHE